MHYIWLQNFHTNLASFKFLSANGFDPIGPMYGDFGQLASRDKEELKFMPYK